VKKGEVLAMMGPSGSGKSEIDADAVFAAEVLGAISATVSVRLAGAIDQPHC
jgi:ABC-type uncharacterized transport system YnjBCD ATPase subunit